MSDTTPAPLLVSLEEIALLLIRTDRFVNTGNTTGSILASDGQAWRYQDDQLIAVPWGDYETALSSDHRNDWPPYTISFTVSSLSADQTVKIDVTTDYDMGISEDSRGGNESIWTLRYQGGDWHILAIEYMLSWD